MDDRSLWFMAGTFVSRLRTLSALLDKGAAFAEAQGLPFETLSQASLAPDMFRLSQQVSVACRMAWQAVSLLSGGDAPPIEPIGDRLADLKGRIAETVARIESVGEAAFAGAAARPVVLNLGETRQAEFVGAEFLRDWSLPNFYFHLTTAYDILRHKGVALGKSDFMQHAGPHIRERAG